jgi:prephenate dehydrogenase
VRIDGTDSCPDVLQHALERGILDAAHADLQQAVADADLVVFCTPVDCIAAQVLGAAAACRWGTLLTDVGSTKANIVHAVEGKLPPGVVFVGSHPLAGSEKHGPEHARADLFKDRLVVVTPAEDEALSRVAAFWTALGARVETMSAEEHDRALALTSHLPHLLASALAGILPPQWRGLTASGFRDTTRLAAANPALWTSILHANQESVLDALDRLGDQLHRFRQALSSGDTNLLEALLYQGKQVRDSLRNE